MTSRLLATVCLAIGVLAAPGDAQLSHANAPDLVLVGGKVFTADSARPWAEAVAIRGERIVGVGTSADVLALAGPGSRIIDVGGRVVVPGFNDGHDHVSGGSPGYFISMGGPAADPSAAQILDSLRIVTARVPPGTWVRADIWLAALNDTTLRRAALDRVAPNHPVLLSMPTGHGSILNSAALRTLGIGDAEPDVFGGWYERDANGRLTGRLDEYAGWKAVRTLRMTQPESTLIANLRRYADRELRLGITSVQNMANSMDAATTVRVLQAARLPLRVRVFRFSIPGATSLDVDAWAAVPKHPGPLLTVAGRKWILDGTPVERFALMRDAYEGQPGWHGRLNFPIDSMRAMLAATLTSGEPLALHISGDSTAMIVLSLMEALAPDALWRQHRVRFEHGGSVTPDMRPRVAAKGIVLVYNLQLLPPPEISRTMPRVPLADVVSEAIPMALGSDGEPRSPFAGMYYALSFPFEPQISRELLVRAYTSGSAFAEFEERDIGYARARHARRPRRAVARHLNPADRGAAGDGERADDRGGEDRLGCEGRARGRDPDGRRPGPGSTSRRDAFLW